MNKFIIVSMIAFHLFAAGRIEMAPNTKKEVVKVLELNETLHASFFEYDGAKVEEAAKKLSTAIDKISDEKIKKLLTFSKTKLSEIQASKTTAENNQSYHLVSMALIHIINTYDVGEKYNAYSCPMVKKKWVQNSSKQDKVHNPYASNMPHCGQKDTKF
ncbi:DUF3347 domain-containing protein [Halobacteriovorax sp. DA5]|uniref:DUF3347 domain-containing protein n=1 Tax=Halobacteriovorax sp. DA5 TaxID=2067553 RepID=UPI000CD166AA|nr:DUF3347 domain-containing protein [Halobacteriovorax sp. DA5]POB13408.1 hypothetical protein C0Z22_09600 [Halobacteriovorax sp. DA5]